MPPIREKSACPSVCLYLDLPKAGPPFGLGAMVLSPFSFCRVEGLFRERPAGTQMSPARVRVPGLWAVGAFSSMGLPGPSSARPGPFKQEGEASVRVTGLWSSRLRAGSLRMGYNEHLSSSQSSGESRFVFR